MIEEAGVVVENEFARTRVRLDVAGNGPRLEVCDLHSGAKIYLGPLELMTLALFSYADLADIVNPERWYREEDLGH